jgi:glyoxylase-like metal-dependent hydrolase (beta-lactamase superfamily II)
MSTFNPIRLEAHNPSPMTGSGNHTYLLIDQRIGVLIDAGVGEPRHLEDLRRALDAHEATLRDVLVTHGHPDHASGAVAIAREHPEARFSKFPWPAEDGRFAVSWLPIGERDRCRFGDTSVVALHTPGHSPDHLTFWHEETRTAFTGDLVVQDSSVMIHATHGGNLSQYLQSLERLRRLSPRRLLPAHGRDVAEPDGLLRGYLEHRRLREAQVIGALKSGRDTVQAIVESIYDGLAPALVPAATENVHAHLDKLREDGLAIETAGRWLISSDQS